MSRSARDTDYAELLEPVRAAITDRSCSALSLDIFDTVLWRRVSRPTDLFALLGRRLRENGRCPDWILEPTFRSMRIDAERRARASRYAIGSEVSLLDIWRFMPIELLGKFPIEELVDAEVQLERAITVHDLDIASLVQLAVKHEIPLILVSDTYFAEDHLRYLLDRPEIEGLATARIFRSHQFGTAKSSGLWKIVLSEMDIEPARLIHVGDHEAADYRVPTKLGIRSIHYARIDPNFSAILEREQEPIEYGAPLSDLIDLNYGDFGITSLRAKAILSGRPHASSSVDQAWRYGAGILGPVLTGFAEWSASKACEAGISTLWCPMREGEMLSNLINGSAAARGWDVTAKPVWLSRHVTALASLDSFDVGEIFEFVRRPYRPTVRQVLSMFDLRPGDVPSLADKLEVIVDVSRAELISTILTENPHLRNRLALASATARERLLASLAKSGALDDRNLTLVDLGWAGTIQQMLARVLRLAHMDIVPSGLYLATNEGSLKLIREGMRAEGYLGQGGHPHKIVRTISRSPEIVEQVVNSPCGSLIGFSDTGTPILGPFTDGAAHQAERQAAQAGVYRFQELWNSHVLIAGASWPSLAQGGQRRLSNILVSSLNMPTAAEAALFGGWGHEENMGSDVVTRNLPSHLLAAIPYLSPNDFQDLNMRDAFWPALIGASDPHLAAAAYALNTGQLSPSTFEQSGKPPEIRLRCSSLDGRWRNGPSRPLRINHNGLSFAHMRFDVAKTDAISLALPGQRAIVRIDWIEVRALAGGDATTEVLRWETGEDLAKLTYVGCSRLRSKLVEFRRPNSELRIPLTVWRGKHVTFAQLMIGFAVLPHSTAKVREPQGATRPAYPTPPPAAGPQRMRRVRSVYRQRGPAGVVAATFRAASRSFRKRV